MKCEETGRPARAMDSCSPEVLATCMCCMKKVECLPWRRGRGVPKGCSWEHTYRSRGFNPNSANLSVDFSFLCFCFSVCKMGLRAGLLWDDGMVHVCISFQKLKMHKRGQFFAKQVKKGKLQRMITGRHELTAL